MPHARKNVVVMVGTAVCTTALAASALAQETPAEGPPTRVTPGWVFTPTVAMGATHDDNPVLAGRGNPSTEDMITTVRPGADLTFTSKHGFFGGGYRGAIQRYRVLDEYDSYDQGAYAELRQQPSQRVSFFLRDNFSISPTTDLVEVAGLPFSRTGTRQNDFNGGITGRVSKTVQLTGTYQFQWIEFDHADESVSALLQGGRSQSVSVGAHKTITTRLKLGGTYGVQRARIGQEAGAETFNIQNAQATASYQLSRTVDIEGGVGVSHLALGGLEGTRTGPAGQVSIRKRTEHAHFSLSAMRSFVPSYGFGGSFRNQQVLGTVRVPFARNRAYSDTSIAWRRSDPAVELGLQLTSFWVQTRVGYAFERWLRIEGFYSGAFQDTTVAGGRVDRNRIGVQVVTARPMRLR